jgi:hypothetical protein
MLFSGGLFHGFQRRFLGPSPPHHHRRRRGRQILNLHVDREAFTSNLGDDRRGFGFF